MKYALLSAGSKRENVLVQGCQLGSFGAKFLDFGCFYLPLALKISFGSFLLFGSFLALLEY